MDKEKDKDKKLEKGKELEKTDQISDQISAGVDKKEEEALKEVLTEKEDHKENDSETDSGKMGKLAKLFKEATEAKKMEQAYSEAQKIENILTGFTKHSRHDSYKTWNNLDKLSVEMLTDKNTILSFVKKNGKTLEAIINHLKKKEEDGLLNKNEKETFNEIKDDPEINLIAFENGKNGLNSDHLYMLEENHSKLLDNKDFISKIIKLIGELGKEGKFDYYFHRKSLSDKLKENRDINILLVENGQDLNRINNKFKEDEDFALFVIEKRGGEALSWCSPELQNKPKIVLAALKKEKPDSWSAHIIESASPDLKGNKSFILEVVEINGLCLEYVSPELQKDPDVVSTALKQNLKAYDFVSQELLDKAA